MSTPTPLDGTADTSGSAGDREHDDPCPHCGARVADSWLVCAWCGEALAAPAELPVGTVLSDGRFVIGPVLGRGGFGITYAVDDRRLQRQVAVKELFPDAAVRHGAMVLTPPEARLAFRDARTRFLGEARVLARFSHPGIVRVYEVFEEHNTAYLVMELLEGRTLSQLLRTRGGPFTVAEGADVAVRVGAALRAVHAAGVLHRDLNPTNVVLTDHGRVVLIDFGIARSFDQGTRSLTRMVTPGYAPPEQYVGAGRFGPSTDIYGLAATLYRLLTNRVPVTALERQGGASLPSPRSLLPELPKNLSDAIMDGLELNPDHRPASIDAFLARLGSPSDPDGPRSCLIDGFPVTARPTGQEAPPAAPTPTPSPPARGALPKVRPPVPASPSTSAADPPTVLGAAPVTDRAPAPPPPVRLPPSPIPVAGPAPDGFHPPDGDWFDPSDPHGAPGRAIGPHRPGLWKATLLPMLALVACSSAAPVIFVILLVLAVLPGLATAGDLILHQYRLRYGDPDTWLARRSAGVASPVRLASNVVTSIVRAVPALCLDAVLIGAWAAAHAADAPVALQEAMLRLAGAAAALVLLIPARHGSPRFRVDVALDRFAERTLTERGGLEVAGWAAWIISIAVIALAFWLHPDPWPIHG